ncbi:MAG: DUF3489 domain-containing protein [Erythrobacter sp.]|uniref:DUF3489 domain-containing protein n=1 Tax=Erythrobacter sp. TaxID=1042 RepID=UPI003C717913
MTDTTTTTPESRKPEREMLVKTSTPMASTASDASVATVAKPGGAKAALKLGAKARTGKKTSGAVDFKTKPKTKASQVEALLVRKTGATLDQMCEATGWQAHTCRAFMTGLRKKGRKISRETNKKGKSVYLMAKSSKAKKRS